MANGEAFMHQAISSDWHAYRLFVRIHQSVYQSEFLIKSIFAIETRKVLSLSSSTHYPVQCMPQDKVPSFRLCTNEDAPPIRCFCWWRLWFARPTAVLGIGGAFAGNFALAKVELCHVTVWTKRKNHCVCSTFTLCTRVTQQMYFYIPTHIASVSACDARVRHLASP